MLEEENMTAYFEGGVTAWDDNGRTLTTELAVYEGATERLVVPVPVKIVDGLRTLDAVGLV